MTIEVVGNLDSRLVHRHRANNHYVKPPVSPPKPYPDQLLERAIQIRAGRIAATVRVKGEQRFGPMWSEITGLLPDGREAHLQSSADALEIAVGVTEAMPQRIHVRCNLTKGIVNTYEQWQPDHRPAMYYNQPAGERFPTTLSDHAVLTDVKEILAQVESMNLS